MSYIYENIKNEFDIWNKIIGTNLNDNTNTPFIGSLGCFDGRAWLPNQVIGGYNL